MSADREAAIARRARAAWEADGCPGDCALDYWLRAEREEDQAARIAGVLAGLDRGAAVDRRPVPEVAAGRVRKGRVPHAGRARL